LERLLDDWGFGQPREVILDAVLRVVRAMASVNEFLMAESSESSSETGSSSALWDLSDQTSGSDAHSWIPCAFEITAAPRIDKTGFFVGLRASILHHAVVAAGSPYGAGGTFEAVGPAVKIKLQMHGFLDAASSVLLKVLKKLARISWADVLSSGGCSWDEIVSSVESDPNLEEFREVFVCLVALHRSHKLRLAFVQAPEIDERTLQFVQAAGRGVQQLLQLVEAFAFDDYVRAAVYSEVGTYFQCLAIRGLHCDERVSHEQAVRWQEEGLQVSSAGRIVTRGDHLRQVANVCRFRLDFGLPDLGDVKKIEQRLRLSWDDSVMFSGPWLYGSVRRLRTLTDLYKRFPQTFAESVDVLKIDADARRQLDSLQSVIHWSWVY